jgi:hypothetical protein
MSTTQALTSADLSDRGDFDYRPLNAGAIVSVVLGLLSSLIFFAGRDSLESALWITPIPLIAIAVGWRAIKKIRDNPDHMSGAVPAKAGIALGAAFLAGGMAFAGYVHATEVPSGYTRTSFAELKPSDIELQGDHFVPPDVAALDGQKVFIKGYIRPDSTQYRENISEFLLVRDNNQCCFGDLSTVQYFDQMAVAMAGDLTVDYRQGLFRMGGTLHIQPQNAANGSGRPVFILEADHAE